MMIILVFTPHKMSASDLPTIILRCEVMTEIFQSLTPSPEVRWSEDSWILKLAS